MKDHYLLIQILHFHAILITKHKLLLHMFIKMLRIHHIIQINMKKSANWETALILYALKFEISKIKVYSVQK